MNTNQQHKTIDDTYFRRFFVPIVISLLVIAGIFVIIAATPGTPVNWVANNNNMTGGMRRLFGNRR